jgi:CRISPR-associated protein Csm3
MKIKKHAEVRGTITALTGLKIGGTKETAGVGETDNPIIRHPITRLPYIPGSSLKGKLRSLLELKHSHRTQSTGSPCDCTECEICALFGSAIRRNREAESKLQGLGPSRLIFRDAPLNLTSRDELKELPGAFVEVKSEIAMDRKTGGTKTGSLRQQERVPEGTSFDFDLTLRLFDEDFSRNRAEKYLDLLAEGFEMLEKDYLGGCGTRGYGRVQISSDEENPRAMHEYLRDPEIRRQILS